MPALTSVLFILALALAVTLGPQTRPWSWGPALVLLALSLLASLPVLLRGRRLTDTGLIFLGILASLWFALRAWCSPVQELAMADILLLCSAIASFVAARVIAGSDSATRIFMWGLWLLVAASVYLVIRQITDPSYNAIYPVRPGAYSSGFFGHYNDGANFLLGASFLLAGAGFFGNESRSVRWLWSMTALVALGSVHFTHSRSGLLSGAVAAGLFCIFSLIHAKRHHPKWFGPLLLGLPLLAFVIVGLLFQGWMSAQNIRAESAGVGDVLSNAIRLHLWGIALSCVGLHPWIGGGSRSYSWESNQFWDFNAHGWQQLRPEYPHNEFLQALTDYGAFGLLLLIALIFTIIVSSLIRTQPESKGEGSGAGIAYGGLAALCAMLIQGSFNFVFHLLPGAILLGFAIGQSSMPGELGQRAARWLNQVARWCLIMVSLGAACLMAYFGTRGIRVMHVLSPVIFRSTEETTLGQRIEATERAVQIWPQAILYKELAFHLQKSAREDLVTNHFTLQVEKTVAAYQAGLALHPSELSLSINLADLLSYVDVDEKASAEYQRAIRLQGGMEMGFGGHRKFAWHLAKVGGNLLAAGESSKAFEAFAKSHEEYENTVAGNPVFASSPEGTLLKEKILGGLGRSAENSGDLEGALKHYKLLSDGGSVAGDFQTGMLLGKMARTAYSERRASEAHFLFLKAREHLAKVPVPTEGVDPAEIRQQLAYFTKMIDFFITTNVPPLEIPAK